MASSSTTLLNGGLALYVHIPFCEKRCSYCAFNTYAGLGRLIPAYVSALCREVNWIGRAAGRRLKFDTVYFGGGTPSLLSIEQLAQILQTISAVFHVQDSAEITLEANPGGLDAAYLAAIRRLGVTRLSLGAQSAHAGELALLGRRHDWAEVAVAVQAARSAGFSNVNIDLIYGVPGQTLATWRETLAQAVALAPEHMSLYGLGIEPGTPLYRRVATGKLVALDDDLAADMYDYATGYLAEEGFDQYEISNWARPGYVCQHNLQYWRRLPYLGVGAGGYGFVEPVRYGTVDRPAEYVRLMSDPRIDCLSTEQCSQQFPLSPAVDLVKVETITPQQARAETMILGLRLVKEGVSRRDFERRFGQRLDECYGNELAKLEARGLLQCLEDRVVLTAQARLIANLALREFV